MKKGDLIALEKEKVDGGKYTLEAVVNWVVGDEAGIEFMSPPDWKGGSNVVNIKEEAWVVIRDSTPSFQSSVGHMTEEELRKSIDDLRESRSHIPVTKVRSAKVKTDNPLAKAFSNLSKEKREEIMKKLGMEGVKDGK